jgi:hypothetical protein
MTINEQDKFIKQMIANHDMLVTASREASQMLDGLLMECEVSEEVL